MDRFTALLDACVLYPAPLRDLFLHLALEDLFQPKWSHEIHEEWIRNVLKARPDLRREQLERTRDLMNAHAEESIVSGYEDLIQTLSLPDPDDRHVLAAAIHSRAEIIVTFNLRHFPQEALRPFDLEAVHLDLFVLRILDSVPAEVCSAVRRQRAKLKNPPRTVDQLLATLERDGLPMSVERLRAFADEL